MLAKCFRLAVFAVLAREQANWLRIPVDAGEQVRTRFRSLDALTCPIAARREQGAVKTSGGSARISQVQEARTCSIASSRAKAGRRGVGGAL